MSKDWDCPVNISVLDLDCTSKHGKFRSISLHLHSSVYGPVQPVSQQQQEQQSMYYAIAGAVSSQHGQLVSPDIQIGNQ
jgi:hypothetical protein